MARTRNEHYEYVERDGLFRKRVKDATGKYVAIMIGSLRLQDGFFSAYHMNKDAWISILLDRPDLDESIKNLLNLSYELTGNKRKSHSIKK